MKTAFKTLGKYGLIQDIPGYAIDVPAITIAENVHGEEESIATTPGYDDFVEFDPTGGGAEACYHIQGVKDEAAGTYYNVLFGDGSASSYDGTTQTNLEDGADPFTSSINWATDIINGNIVATNGVDPPVYWDLDTSNDFAPLTDWNANYCQVIRSFKGYLIALNVTKGGVDFPYRLKWSEQANVGIPADWDETDPASGAGEIDLGDNAVVLLDGAVLRDTFFIYAEDRTFGMQFVGGNSVWRFYTAFPNFGILAKHCVASFDNKHLVIVDGDVRVHDGHTNISVIDEKNRKWMFDLIDPNNYANTFCVRHEEQDEIWICFPSAGNTWPNKSLIYNYRDNTWWQRDIPANTTFIAPVVDQTGTPLTWADASMTWEEATFRWGEQLYNPTRDSLIGADSAGQITKFDVGIRHNGAVRQSYIERTGIKLNAEEEAAVNTITDIYPRMQGNSISIEIGYAQTPNGAYSWVGPYTYDPDNDYKIDCLATGRYHGIRIYNNTQFRISELVIEWEPNGER